MVDNCFIFPSIFSSLFRSPFIFSIFLFLASCDNSPENLSVSSLFSDGMVLQRDTTVAIWGQALPESNVYLYPSWGNMVKTKSDSTGFWRTFAKTTIDQKNHSLRIKSGKDKIFIKDILMGEVWIASGQSNMEMDFDYCCNSTDSADFVLNNDMFNSIRMFNVKKRYSLTPSSDIDGRWIKAVKDSIKHFSAVGYFFAKKLHNSLDVPVGDMTIGLDNSGDVTLAGTFSGVTVSHTVGDTTKTTVSAAIAGIDMSVTNKAGSTTWTLDTTVSGVDLTLGSDQKITAAFGLAGNRMTVTSNPKVAAHTGTVADNDWDTTAADAYSTVAVSRDLTSGASLTATYSTKDDSLTLKAAVAF